MSSRKLKKASHPPPSFRPPRSSELGFIAHSPPSLEQSNFPYSFHTCYQDRVGYRTEARSSLSRSNSLPLSPRPATVLSVNSGITPLITHLGPTQRHFSVAAAAMPARKLTKARKQAGLATDQYASLSSSPTMESTTLLTPALSRKRSTINWNVAWSFKRRKNDTLQHITTPKSKKFSLGPEEPDSDVEVDDYPPRSPSPPRRKVYDLDPAHDDLPIPPPSTDLPRLHLPRPQPRPHPLSQPLPHDSDQLGVSHIQRRNSVPVSRRWTLAMVMTNTDMDDESFVKQVEAMRRASVFADSDSPPLTGSDDGEEYYYYGHNGEPSHTSDYYDDEYALSMEDATSSYYHTSAHTPLRVPSTPNFASPPPDLYAPLPFNPPTAENEWSSALHALLITRDLLKTERNYLASLLLLLNSSPCAVNASLHPDDSKVSTPQLPWPRHPPPALMHTYLLSLISTAHILIAKFESDPSVMGAATTFVECEEEVEKVFVGWCGVVGGWFTGRTTKRRRLSKTRFPEGKLTPSPSSTRMAGPPSPSRRKSFKSLSGHTTPSSSTLRLSVQPPLPDISLPSSLPASPTSLTTVAANYSAPPRVPRVCPVRPLSIITPVLLSPNSTATTITTTGCLPSADKRPPMSRIPSERCENRPLPPLPIEQQNKPEQQRGQESEEQEKETGVEKEKVKEKTISRSNSAVRLLSLVGVGRKRTNSQANGAEEKPTKPKLTKSSPGPPKAGGPSRSKSVLLITNRSDTKSPAGSGLKRSMSDYWRKSVLPAFPSSSSSRHKVTLEPIPVLPPLPPLPTLSQVFSSPARTEGNGNRASNGPNSAATSSGHGTDEGFYSAEGGAPPSGTQPTSRVVSPAASPVVSGASGVVIDARTNRRVYSVRDLAILPVQRVTRYALLYRDLLNHTPTSSPCRPILERAVEISHRIAQRCDKAQGNAQLLLASRPGRGRT